MSASGGSWTDLRPRTISGIAMVLIGLAAVWWGGLAWLGLVAASTGLMIWELVRMQSPTQTGLAMILGLVCAGAMLASGFLPVPLALPLLLGPSMAGFGQLERGRSVFMAYSVMVMLAGFGLLGLRTEFGFLWMLWLVAVVVVTDIAGYFAGRALGGPKFWPKVSPKKTWSGTAAGWVAAALTGLAFGFITENAMTLMGVSVAVAMASQMGDIAESAIKRRAGVKDSSSLIPGHGGLLDRFDGMLGASVLLLIVGTLMEFPATPVGVM